MEVTSKPVFYVSKLTGNKYAYEDYVNHGRGGYYKGFKDLPINEYPFIIEYKTEPLFAWQRLIHT